MHSSHPHLESKTVCASRRVCVHACRSDLLCPSRPATAPDGSVRLYLDENHQRALQACGGRGTASSMKGAGVTVVAEVSVCEYVCLSAAVVLRHHQPCLRPSSHLANNQPT